MPVHSSDLLFIVAKLTAVFTRLPSCLREILGEKSPLFRSKFRAMRKALGHVIISKRLKRSA